MKLKPTIVLTVLLCFVLALSACMRGNTGENSPNVPEIPEKLDLNADGIPVLKVYDVNSGSTEEMDLESYIMGVVAGEMKNDWPVEALKAQAILARTFTLKFVSDKDSIYSGADISTDVKEAQAYRASEINDRVRKAVNETRGMVMSADGELPYAWFHAHSGGMTELPSKALEYKEDPSYLSPVSSPESNKAPENNRKWTAVFSLEQVQDACKGAGVETGTINSFEINERGASGRAVSFKVNGRIVSAPAFRIQIGTSKLKSTLIDNISMDNGAIRFSGRGFGHGVGMSQWGAYDMAENGKTAEEIIDHYFTDVEILKIW